MKLSLGSAILLVGAVIGYLTGINALGRAGQASVDGKWVQGLVNAKDAYALYAIGHFRQEGSLPPSHAVLYFTRLVDDEGNGLRSGCVYKLSGPQPPARWWSISASAPGGGPHATFAARDAVLTADDQFSLAISRRAAPGNWLAIDDVGNLQIALVMNEPYPLAKSAKLVLPNVKRMGCE
jgi:hypothetical protein